MVFIVVGSGEMRTLTGIPFPSPRASVVGLKLAENSGKDR